MSDKVAQTKETVVETADKTKKFGEEKVGDAQKQFDSANKEAESQLNAANNSSDPSFVDQAKEKAAQAKEAAASAQEKMTGAVTDGWTKTKDTLNNLNQYPDKK